MTPTILGIAGIIGASGGILGPIVTLFIALRRISPIERQAAAAAAAETKKKREQADEEQDAEIQELRRQIRKLNARKRGDT